MIRLFCWSRALGHSTGAGWLGGPGFGFRKVPDCAAQHACSCGLSCILRDSCDTRFGS